MLLKLAIIDTRESYLQRLVDAFRTDFADRLEVTAFTSLQSFAEFTRSNTVDVMLVGSDLASEDVAGLRGATLVYLVDDKSVESVYGHRALCRFQRTDLIYKGILDACSDRFEHMRSRRVAIDDVNIISFFPASGGAGASSMAAACALGAAKRGFRAFYLNLELFGEAATYFQGPGYGSIDDVLFAIEGKNSNVGIRLQSAVKRSAQGVWFLDSSSNAYDVAEMTAEHFERLVTEIAATGNFDVLVLDLDYAYSKLASTAIEMSSRSVFVSNGTPISNRKFERLYQMLQEMNRSGIDQNLGKVVLAYNNFSSKTGRRLAGDAVPVVGGLPRVVCADAFQLIDALSAQPLFDSLVLLPRKQESI